jgi:hypothetical protein
MKQSIIMLILLVSAISVEAEEKLVMKSNPWSFFGKATITQGDIVYSLKKHPKDQVSLYDLGKIDENLLHNSINKANGFYRSALLLDIPGITLASVGMLLSALAFVEEGVIYVDLLAAGIVGMGAGFALHLPAVPLYKAGDRALRDGVVNPYNNEWGRSIEYNKPLIEKVSVMPIAQVERTTSFGIGINFDLK